MFAEVELERTVAVQPDAMRSSAHIQRALILALMKDVKELRCTAEHGYYVTPTTLEHIGEGRLLERRGCALFPVRFKCVVFTVIKREHVLAVVHTVMDSGVLCHCGPMETLFIASGFLKGYRFWNEDSTPGGRPMWVKSGNEAPIKGAPMTDTSMKEGVNEASIEEGVNEASIKVGVVLRVEILGCKWEPAQRILSALGSLLGKYSGVDDRFPEQAGEGGTDIGTDIPGQVGATESAWGGDDEADEDDGGWG